MKKPLLTRINFALGALIVALIGSVLPGCREDTLCMYAPPRIDIPNDSNDLRLMYGVSPTVWSPLIEQATDIDDTPQTPEE